ncbi:MAG: hypothetical protein Q9184_005954 [Pyrenodesmia sp. 2 TL-2023]
MATRSRRSLLNDILHVKSANFSYTFSLVVPSYYRQIPGEPIHYDYTTKISQDYERIQRLADRFEIILMSHTSFNWHEEITILAGKANEWLIELEMLEANVLEAWIYVAAKRRGLEFLKVTAGFFCSLLTRNANNYAAGEGWCSWYVQSPDGTIHETSDDLGKGATS